MDRDRILKFMQQTRMQTALIRSNGNYYFCKLTTEPSAWEGYPQDSLQITECPPPIELV
jgi:hypothetical protein